MDLQMTKEQIMVRDMIRDFAQSEFTPFIENMEQGEFPTPILKKMGDLGLMGMTTPENLGGAGMDFTSYILAINELSKVSAVVAVILSVHTSVGTNPILYFGSEEQKKKY
ncbi:acyl-CoA dehydrogenase family protein, partial [Butyricicoccus sp. 1XD8-22]